MTTFHALKYLYLDRNKFGRCFKKSYLSGRCYLPRSKLPTFTVLVFELSKMSHCNFPRGVWPRSSNGLVVILKNTLELEQWNQELAFAQWTNRKQRGPQRNSLVRSFSNIFLPKLFGVMATTTSHQRSILKIQKPYYVPYRTSRTVLFCQNIWILSRDPVPLRRWFLTVSCLFSIPGSARRFWFKWLCGSIVETFCIERRKKDFLRGGFNNKCEWSNKTKTWRDRRNFIF